MAGITTCVPNYTKKALFDGLYLAADTYKCCLFKVGVGRTYDKTSTKYGDITASTSDEHAASGNYATGGATISRVTVTAGDTTYLDFGDATWSNSTISATGCAVYDDTDSTTPDGLLILQDFGGTVSSTSATFTVSIVNLLSLASA